MHPERAAVIAEARSWIGTPYHNHGRAKGVGVDCLMYIAEVFIRAGVVEPMEIPYYSPQWHLHRNREMYVEGLLQYMREVETPEPADVAVWKFGRCFSHGAIVTEWPFVLQSVKGKVVHEDNANHGAFFMDKGVKRPVRFFSRWGR